MRYTLVILILFSIAAGQTAVASPYSDTSKAACLRNASKLLDEALLIMEKRYYKKGTVNWDSLVTAAKSRVTSATNCDDVYEHISWCFQQLSETHSFVMPPAKTALYKNDTARLKESPPLNRLVGEIKMEVHDEVGYISIPWISTTDQRICTMIADSIQQTIASLDSMGVSKWIVDLRKNTGGNCWPMIAGIGALLGNGTYGYFVSAESKISFGYQDGASMQGRHKRCEVTAPYQLKNSTKHIAILTGPRTSSSGEIIALAFKGMDNVMFLGEPTAGYTTANSTYPLSDNSTLVLTVCMEADRTGKVYEGKILPDEIVMNDPRNRHDDLVKGKAIMWLQMQQ